MLPLPKMSHFGRASGGTRRYQGCRILCLQMRLFWYAVLQPVCLDMASNDPFAFMHCFSACFLLGRNAFGASILPCP